MTNGDDEGGRRVGETSSPNRAERLDNTADTAALAVQMEDPDAPRPHIDVQALCSRCCSELAAVGDYCECGE